jgi:hypothetical protein
MNPRARPDLTARAVDGETVLLDRERGRVHQFNRTATFIWSRLDGRNSPQELAAALADAFEVGPETAGRDVEALLARFAALGLLVADMPRGGDDGRR